MTRRLLVFDRAGQALVEAAVVFPILIMMCWGVWHLHDTAFYSARAAMAARHGAWILSIDEEAGSMAAQAVLDVFYDKEGAVSGENSDIILSYTVSNNNSLDTTDSAAANAARAFFDTGAGGFIKAFIDAIPFFQPFTRNVLATVVFQVDTPLGHYEKDDDPSGLKFMGKTYGSWAYFATRIKRLYFHNSWDFFNGGIGQTALGDATSEAEDGMDDASEDFDDAADDVNDDDLYGEHDGNVYTYDDYTEALEKWREWLRNRS
jgi:hypothetical protein